MDCVARSPRYQEDGLGDAWDYSRGLSSWGRLCTKGDTTSPDALQPTCQAEASTSFSSRDQIRGQLLAGLQRCLLTWTSWGQTHQLGWLTCPVPLFFPITFTGFLFSNHFSNGGPPRSTLDPIPSPPLLFILPFLACVLLANPLCTRQPFS